MILKHRFHARAALQTPLKTPNVVNVGFFQLMTLVGFFLQKRSLIRREPHLEIVRMPATSFQSRTPTHLNDNAGHLLSFNASESRGRPEVLFFHLPICLFVCTIHEHDTAGTPCGDFFDSGMNVHLDLRMNL